MSRTPGDWLLRTGALEAFTTLDVYRPVSRRGPLSPLVFFSTWPVSELPVQAAMFQVATAAALARPRDMRSRRGMAGLALTAASVAGLLGVRRAADRVEGELELALVDALGPQYRDEIRRPGLARPRRPRRTSRPGALRSMLIRKRFAQGKDVAVRPARRAQPARRLAPRRPSQRRESACAASGSGRRAGSPATSRCRRIR